MRWTVKTLNDKHEWVPVDPATPTYDTWREAYEACNDYRKKYPRARIEIARDRSEE